MIMKYKVTLNGRTYEVEVEAGYGTSINVGLPEIDGSKAEGEW